MFSRKLASGVELRPLELGHAPALFALVERNRAHLRRWLPWVDATTQVADTERALRAMLAQTAANNGFQTTIWVQGALAGIVGLHAIDWANRKTSIGYWLDAAQEGRGTMTSACRALVDHLLRELGLNRVEIRAATGNRRSRAIPERLGFAHEGTAREAEWLYDHFVDHEVYGMLARDWPGQPG